MCVFLGRAMKLFFGPSLGGGAIAPSPPCGSATDRSDDGEKQDDLLHTFHDYDMSEGLPCGFRVVVVCPDVCSGVLGKSCSASHYHVEAVLLIYGIVACSGGIRLCRQFSAHNELFSGAIR